MARKERVRRLLEARDLDGILAWAASVRGAFRVLLAFTFEPEDLLRWRAVEALGRTAAQRAEADLEGVRNLVRGLFWSMSDESGGTGWHAPEGIGEVLYNVPDLVMEFGKILPSFFHEEPFERGAYWAVARVSVRRPGPFEDAAKDLARGCEDPDPYIRAFAGRALRALGAEPLLPEKARRALSLDGAPLVLYDFDSGTLRRTTVSEFTGAKQQP